MIEVSKKQQLLERLSVLDLGPTFETLDRRQQGPDAPNVEIDLRIRGRHLKKKEIFTLAALTHQVGADRRWLLVLLSEEQLVDFDLSTRIGVRALLQSKERSDRWLFEVTDRVFFGTTLPSVSKLLSRISIQISIRPRSKRKIRHRGYRDHGSLRPESKWIESSDWSFTEEQMLIEEHREIESSLSRYLGNDYQEFLIT